MPEKGKSSETAPKGAARKASLPKRFYKEVAVKDEEGGGASLLLDGKPVRTPGKAALALPARALAEAIAAEWRAQGERIDPSTMPLTRLANSAIDGVKGREQAVIDDIARHAGSDLLCYRAEGPEGLGRGAEARIGIRCSPLRGTSSRRRSCSRRASCTWRSPKPRSRASGRRSKASIRSRSRRCM